MVLLVATLCKSDKVERLYQAEGLPKNISIEEFCTKHGVDFPTFDKWYRKTHKKVYPITVTGMPAEEEAEIQSEAAKVSEESKVHDPVRHPFKYPADRVANISKKISISIKFPDGMKIVKTGISFTEIKHHDIREGQFASGFCLHNPQQEISYHSHPYLYLNGIAVVAKEVFQREVLL